MLVLLIVSRLCILMQRSFHYLVSMQCQETLALHYFFFNSKFDGLIKIVAVMGKVCPFCCRKCLIFIYYNVKYALFPLNPLYFPNSQIQARFYRGESAELEQQKIDFYPIFPCIFLLFLTFKLIYIIQSRLAIVWNSHFIIFSFRARFIFRSDFVKLSYHSFPPNIVIS